MNSINNTPYDKIIFESKEINTKTLDSWWILCIVFWKRRKLAFVFAGGKGIVAAEIENDRITSSMLKSQSDSQKKRLKDVELEVRQSTQVLRDLSINIK